jgi:iron complex transport system substrate-binding protein
MALACGSSAPPAAHAAARIVTLLPNLTEIVVALGAGERIVGCTSYCPREGLRTEVAVVGAPLGPNLERIAALRPDLILLQDTQRAWRDRLRAMNLRAVEVPGQSMADVFAAVRTIAGLLDVADTGERLNKRLKGELDDVAQRVAGARPLRTLLVIGHDPGALREIFLAGRGTFIDRLLQIAGGANALEASPVAYPKVGVEEVLRVNPQAVFVLAPDENDTPAAQEREARLWSALAYLDAVKNGRVYLVTGRDVMTPGPRMADTAAHFARLLHPEAWR